MFQRWFGDTVDIITKLKSEGAKVKVYDPKAMGHAKTMLKGVVLCKDPYSVAEDADGR